MTPNLYYYNQTASPYFYNQTQLYTNGTYLNLTGNVFAINPTAYQWFYNQTQGFNYSLQIYNATFKNVSADFFFGDGSKLTNLPSGVSFWKATATTLYNDTAGVNVGIGTSTPSNKLSVVGTGNITGGSATTQGLLVDSSGRVGIGTANPSSKFEVVGTFNVTNATGASGKPALVVYPDASVVIGDDTSKYSLSSIPYSDLILINNITGPRITLVSQNNSVNTFSAYQFADGIVPNIAASIARRKLNNNLEFYLASGAENGIPALIIENSTNTIITNTSINIGFGIATTSVPYNSFGAGTPSSGAGIIADQDDVFIKDDLEVDGTAYLAGGTAWTQGDIAENIETKASRENKFCKGDVSCYGENTNDELDYGDLVCIDISKGHTIMKCNEANSRLAVGVITNTSVLQVGPFTGYPVSLAGIVWTHVTNENGNIMPGDLLVSSSMPGYAMKNNDPKTGTVIGKAFDFCDKPKCDIKIFVALN